MAQHISFAPAASDAVLALLVASYGKPATSESAAPKAAAPRAPKASKSAKIKASAVEPSAENAAPIAPKAPVAILPLPPKGTYSAREFFVVLRRASNRDQEIQAIAGYVGYDRYADFGTQLMAAKMAASRETHPVKAALRPAHSAVPTAAGFVSGMPDGTARKVSDLLAR